MRKMITSKINDLDFSDNENNDNENNENSSEYYNYIDNEITYKRENYPTSNRISMDLDNDEDQEFCSNMINTQKIKNIYKKKI